MAAIAPWIVIKYYSTNHRVVKVLFGVLRLQRETLGKKDGDCATKPGKNIV